MEIGKVICKYRKKKEMTQEEMAARLGVSAPAVNKWERGNSLPDITLLAPIARLLDITLEELLSFRSELTKEEVRALTQEAGEMLFGTPPQPFGEVFAWVKKKLALYPNCAELTLRLAQQLDSALVLQRVEHTEAYEDFILECYGRVLRGTDEELKITAADCLQSFYLRKEQYEAAAAYLDYFPKEYPLRKYRQGIIFEKTGRMEEAYKAYEEILFSGFNLANLALNNLYQLAVKAQDAEKMRFLTEKQTQLAAAYDMGIYYEATPRYALAAQEKDADMTIASLKILLGNLEEVCAFLRSPLYEHMKFKEISPEFYDRMKQSIFEGMQNKEEFAWLQGDARWEKFLDEEMEKMRPDSEKG